MSEKTMTEEEKETLKKEALEARQKEGEKNTEKQGAFAGLRQLQEVVKEALLNEKDRNEANAALMELNGFINKY